MNQDIKERLSTQLEEIFFRHDPIEINYEFNTDEYEPEARTILPRLQTAKDESDVLNIIFEEFVKWFGADGVENKESFREIAAEVWQLWTNEKARG